MFFDIKSFVLCILLSVTVGGGAYGYYIKTLSNAAIGQGKLYGAYGECSRLISSHDTTAMKLFLGELESLRVKTQEIRSCYFCN